MSCESPSLTWKVNTGAAEVLYSAVGEWAQLDQDSTVLDVCCGTGTIGISLAKVISAVFISIKPMWTVFTKCLKSMLNSEGFSHFSPCGILLFDHFYLILLKCLLKIWMGSPDLLHLNVICNFQRVKRVIGIEMCQEAVEDARVNAKLNGRAPDSITHPACWTWITRPKYIMQMFFVIFRSE